MRENERNGCNDGGGPRKKKHGRVRRTLTLLLTLALLVAALLLMMKYDVISIGKGGVSVPALSAAVESGENGGGNGGGAQAPEATEGGQDGEAPATDPARVEVREGAIWVTGEEKTLDGLRAYLLETHEDGMTWRLVDAQAIKSAYDGAKALMEELELPFIEEVA